ncbi:MAG: Gfo/Idh/MocA family oxidoreductase [Methylacidiphilales bacterium]|nr:Gfo/Idh/MocA family oxidoreductase [Candidatus Methylacidiphilales bacterium]
MNKFNILYNYEYPAKLKTAFIGCGGHACRNVFPTFQYAPVNLTAVCDLDAKRATDCAKIFGAESAYTDHREMLAKEKPDLVFIVTNYDEYGRPRYPKLAIDCMRAGAHAWIEKPPAASSSEVEEMMRVSRETGRHTGVGFKKMFFPANQKIKEIISRPEFGRVTSITARYPQDLPPFEDRADAKKMAGFLDHMVHPHSLLRFLCGDLDWIFTNRNTVNGAASVSLRFKSGAVGNLTFSAGQSTGSFLERTEVIGEGENVVLENNLRLTHYRKASQQADYGRSGDYFNLFADENAPRHWEPEFSLGQPHNKALFLLGYAPEVIHFTTRLLEGKGPEWGTLEDALELLRIYEAYIQPDETIQHILH